MPSPTSERVRITSASGWDITVTNPSSRRPLSALIETSEAPQISPAEAASSVPPWSMDRARGRGREAQGRRAAHVERPAPRPRSRCGPRRRCRRASRRGTPGPAAVSATPIHSRRVTEKPNSRSATTVSSTSPPAITDWTSEIGASASAATWKPHEPVATRIPSVYQRERNSASELAHRPPPLDRRRLDRAAVLVEEADDRRERAREREHAGRSGRRGSSRLEASGLVVVARLAGQQHLRHAALDQHARLHRLHLALAGGARGRRRPRRARPAAPGA